MREIKFRAWDKINKDMIDWDWWMDTSINSLFDNDPIIPLQYTGLKDKNGKEIYEGDIVRTKHRPVSGRYKKILGLVQVPRFVFVKNRVVWDGKSAGFCFKRLEKPGPLYSVTLRSNVTKLMEVIGNIYENPELVESDGDN